MRVDLMMLSVACVISACGGGRDTSIAMRDAADIGVPQNHFSAPQWPVLFSHAWSRNAQTAFQGDTPQAQGEFDHFGVKRDLESLGVTVYQPDKLAYASHETRGQLLYKKCSGASVEEMLCRGSSHTIVDGVYPATLDYCSKAEKRAKHGFATEQICQREIQFNVICHSQGCADSRYMLTAVTNEFSGLPMYRHVASWTSMAGANKGTAQADWVLERLAACALPHCRSLVLDAAFAVDSFSQNQALVLHGSESVVALSRKYMLITTDMDCTPGRGEPCASSFNQLYPLPEDPEHPIYYQTFSSQIDDISHPCYRGNRLFWEVVMKREGPNDGNISVDSQQFTTYGPGSTGGATPVIARSVTGYTSDATRPHPGLNHMAYSSSAVPGMSEIDCSNSDDESYRFSRLALYRNIVTELASWGY